MTPWASLATGCDGRCNQAVNLPYYAGPLERRPTDCFPERDDIMHTRYLPCRTCDAIIYRPERRERTTQPWGWPPSFAPPSFAPPSFGGHPYGLRHVFPSVSTGRST